MLSDLPAEQATRDISILQITHWHSRLSCTRSDTSIHARLKLTIPHYYRTDPCRMVFEASVSVTRSAAAFASTSRWPILCRAQRVQPLRLPQAVNMCSTKVFGVLTGQWWLSIDIHLTDLKEA